MQAQELGVDESAYQRLADLAVREDEKHFHSLLEAMPTGAYTCDAHGLITYYNQRALELWGRAPRLNDPEDRFCGSFKLYSSDGVPLGHDQCWMAMALRSQKGFNGQEILVQRPDGRRVAVMAFANPIWDKNGTLMGAVNVLVDISERKRAEDAARESRDEAVASNQAKDRFLAVLSHELRTPLAPVLMTVSAIEKNPNLPAEFREDMTMIRRNIELEMTLIDDLLDVSRVVSGKFRLNMQPVRIHDKLKFVIRNCASEFFTKSLNVHTSMEAVNDRVTADPARMQQVFWNLLRNAAKFTPKGGDIFIRTWNEQDDSRLGVEVRDTGIGISAEVLPRIFEAFEQGEQGMTRRFGGLGLGLSIARTVIEMHSGSIAAASDGKDLGATFTVRLNTMAANAVQPPAAASLVSGSSAKRQRVMIVEDHQDTANMMARLLKSEGYEVRVAHSVASAMQLAGEEAFDIVVSDIGLPDATGYDLMAQIKGHGAVKGIALSGYGMEEDVQRSFAAGFSEHLVKPVNLSQLQAAIQRLSVVE